MKIVNFLCEKINLSIYLSIYLSFQPISFKNRNNGPSDSVIKILKNQSSRLLENEINYKINYKINVKINYKIK